LRCARTQRFYPDTILHRPLTGHRSFDDGLVSSLLAAGMESAQHTALGDQHRPLGKPTRYRAYSPGAIWYTRRRGACAPHARAAGQHACTVAFYGGRPRGEAAEALGARDRATLRPHGRAAAAPVVVWHLGRRTEMRGGPSELPDAAMEIVDVAKEVGFGIHRLRRNGPDQVHAETVYAPEFCREPIAGAVQVAPEVPLVATKATICCFPTNRGTPSTASQSLDRCLFCPQSNNLQELRVAHNVERKHSPHRPDDRLEQGSPVPAFS
jgi:hypothetical protein